MGPQKYDNLRLFLYMSIFAKFKLLLLLELLFKSNEIVNRALHGFNINRFKYQKRFYDILLRL